MSIKGSKTMSRKLVSRDHHQRRTCGLYDDNGTHQNPAHTKVLEM
jgi:hypothetical protein